MPIADSKIFKEKLGADIIIENKKGHMDEGSRVFKLDRILSELLKIVEKT